MPAPIVVLTQKPSQIREIAPHLARRLHSSDVFVLQTLLFGAGRFTFPRGLRWEDYPRIQPARYRPSPDHWWNACRLHPDGRLERITADPLRLLAAAQALVMAVDCDASGRTSAMTTIGLVGRLRGPIPALWVSSLAKDDLHKAVARMEETPFDPETDRLWAMGEVKRHFDYNWSLNAAPILGRTLEAAGVRAPGTALSKFMVQALYVYARHVPLTDGEAIGLMSRWPGTGRYPQGEMGSCASRGAIVENLRDLGLLEWVPGETKRKHRRVSELGWRLLARLHPDCEDADLPMRLDAWMDQAVGPDGTRSPEGFAAACVAVERYLRTWFGKQKRFVAKGAQRDAAPLRTGLKPPRVRAAPKPPEYGRLHSLYSLQEDMQTAHGWTAQHTLDVAERLHGKGRISAPRADGHSAPRVIADHLAADLVAGLARLPELTADCALVALEHRAPCWDDARAEAQTENAILPSWRFEGDFAAGLEGDERRLFIAVARRFLMQFDPSRAG